MEPMIIASLIAILGISVLVIVHEAGHYLAARAFGMRVVRFSVGFGPTIAKWQRNSTRGRSASSQDSSRARPSEMPNFARWAECN